MGPHGKLTRLSEEHVFIVIKKMGVRCPLLETYSNFKDPECRSVEMWQPHVLDYLMTWWTQLPWELLSKHVRRWLSQRTWRCRRNACPSGDRSSSGRSAVPPSRGSRASSSPKPPGVHWRPHTAYHAKPSTCKIEPIIKQMEGKWTLQALAVYLFLTVGLMRKWRQPTY